MRLCTVEGCGRKYYCRDRCRKHYEQARLRGQVPPLPKTDPLERFWSKVSKTDTCWNWTAGGDKLGYGNFMVSHKNRVKAHRYSYELVHGPIPDGLVVDHICHNPPCIRPSHLRAVTQKQNLENQSGAYSNSKSGVRGVSWHKDSKRWQAIVSHHKKQYFAGRHDTIAEAEAAVIAKRLELHTHNDSDRQQGP